MGLLAACAARPGRRAFYDSKRGAGKTHDAALRALGNRWLEVLWHCLHKSLPYDEAVHAANRNRALAPLGLNRRRLIERVSLQVVSLR